MSARIFQFPAAGRAVDHRPDLIAARAANDARPPLTREAADREWIDALRSATLVIAFALGMLAGSLLLSAAAILIDWWRW